jgi:hypothetical protein
MITLIDGEYIFSDVSIIIIYSSSTINQFGLEFTTISHRVILLCSVFISLN